MRRNEERSRVAYAFHKRRGGRKAVLMKDQRKKAIITLIIIIIIAAAASRTRLIFFLPFQCSSPFHKRRAFYGFIRLFFVHLKLLSFASDMMHADAPFNRFLTVSSNVLITASASSVFR